jgi:hypothetical protein
VKIWKRWMVAPSATAFAIFATASAALAVQPSNDDIANATVVTAIPYTDALDTSEATSDPTDPTDCYNNGSVWYVYTAEADMFVEVNTIGSNYDTTLGVYSGSPGSLTLLGCNDDFYGLQSRVVVEVSTGTTYYVMAGFCCGNGEDGGGSLVLNVMEAPPPLDIELTVDPLGTFDQAGNATITGSLSCNNISSGYVRVFLRQRHGRDFIDGSGITYFDCSPPSSAWSVTVTGDGVFRGGQATLFSDAYFCDAVECDYDTVGPGFKVRLRGGG